MPPQTQQMLTSGMTDEELRRLMSGVGLPQQASPQGAAKGASGGGFRPDATLGDPGAFGGGYGSPVPSGQELAGVANRQGLGLDGSLRQFNLPVASAGLSAGQPVTRQDVYNGPNLTSSYFGGEGGSTMVGQDVAAQQKRALTQQDFLAQAGSSMPGGSWDMMRTSDPTAFAQLAGGDAARQQKALQDYALYAQGQDQTHLGLLGEQRLSGQNAATNALEQQKFGLAGRGQDLAERKGAHEMSSDRVGEQLLATAIAQPGATRESVRRAAGLWKDYGAPGGGPSAGPGVAKGNAGVVGGTGPAGADEPGVSVTDRLGDASKEVYKAAKTPEEFLTRAYTNHPQEFVAHLDDHLAAAATYDGGQQAVDNFLQRNQGQGGTDQFQSGLQRLGLSTGPSGAAQLAAKIRNAKGMKPPSGSVLNHPLGQALGGPGALLGRGLGALGTATGWY